MRRTQQNWRLSLGLAALLSIMLGPATNAQRALHLADADEHHHAPDCQICVDLTVGATADDLPAPTTGIELPPVEARIRPIDSGRPAALAWVTDPLIPRAPPT